MTTMSANDELLIGNAGVVPIAPDQLLELDEPTSPECDNDAPKRTVMGRVAAVMSAFDGGGRALSLSELSERTGLPKSTLHRMNEQLCDIGWLHRDENNYRIGIRLFELGSLALEGDPLPEAARPHLQALAARTGLSAQLGVLDAADVVYLDRVLARSAHLPTRRGGRHPAYCTALGKALAAFDDTNRRAVLAAEMPRLTRNTIIDAQALEIELDRVRQAGFALDRGEACTGLQCVAAPIYNGGRVIGAVSLSGPSQTMRWAPATSAVRDAAIAIQNSTSLMGLVAARAGR